MRRYDTGRKDCWPQSGELSLMLKRNRRLRWRIGRGLALVKRTWQPLPNRSGRATVLLCGLWLLGGTASFLRHHGQEDEITSERRRVISRSLFIIIIGKSSVDDLSLDELVLYAGLAKECLCGGTVLANA